MEDLEVLKYSVPRWVEVTEENESSYEARNRKQATGSSERICYVEKVDEFLSKVLAWEMEAEVLAPGSNYTAFFVKGQSL